MAIYNVAKLNYNKAKLICSEAFWKNSKAIEKSSVTKPIYKPAKLTCSEAKTNCGKAYHGTPTALSPPPIINK